jgi:hypothetical protein
MRGEQKRGRARRIEIEQGWASGGKKRPIGKSWSGSAESGTGRRWMCLRTKMKRERESLVGLVDEYTWRVSVIERRSMTESETTNQQCPANSPRPQLFLHPLFPLHLLSMQQ